MTSRTTGTTASAAIAITSDAVRQPEVTARFAMSGRKISWPVAPAAVRTPVTTPRLRTNHRVATVAAKLIAIEPVPAPISTPQQRISCQLALMKTVPAAPTAMTNNAVAETRRMPNRSISAAAKGAKRP